MKKCPVCNKTFSDNVTECPNCELFLIADIVSDWRENSASGLSERNSRVNKVTSVSSDVSSSSPINDENSLIAGRSVDNNTFDSGKDDTSVVHPNVFFRGLVSLMRILLPILFIGGAVIAIINYWEVISQFLGCCLVGAIIGGITLTYLSVRFGGTFSPGAMTSGAVAGMILACVLRYNILDVGTEIIVLFEALGPLIIILLAIGMILRSLF